MQCCLCLWFDIMLVKMLRANLSNVEIYDILGSQKFDPFFPSFLILRKRVKRQIFWFHISVIRATNSTAVNVTLLPFSVRGTSIWHFAKNKTGVERMNEVLCGGSRLSREGTGERIESFMRNQGSSERKGERKVPHTLWLTFTSQCGANLATQRESKSAFNFVTGLLLILRLCV